MIDTFLWATLLCMVAVIFHARRVGAEQRDENEHLRLLLDNLNTCVCVSCFDTCEVLYTNRKVREEFDLKEQPGQLCWQVLKGEDSSCRNCPKHLESLRDGNYHVWENYNPITKKYYKYINRIITWMGTKAYMQHFMDITEHIEIEDALAENKGSIEAVLVNAQHIYDAKNEFLSRMSHEIKTPMNAIVGMTNIAMQSQNEAEIKNCLNNVHMAVQQLRMIVDDIFDVSKIEARELELMNIPFNFKKTMTAVYEQFKKHTDEKKLEFTLLLDDTIDTMYIGDSARLSQIVGNLLSNAIKFTQEGSIVFSAKQKERLGNEAVVEISISDTGIGISKESIAKLFLPFEQVDGSTTRKYGGIGLGLVLSKNIVELMGGNFEVRSEERKGSTFAFTVKFMIGDKIPSEDAVLNEKTSVSAEDRKHTGFDDSPISPVKAKPVRKKPVPEEPAPKEPAGIETEHSRRSSFSSLQPFINVQRGLENLKGNCKLYSILLQSYQKNDLLEKIRDAVSAGNFKEAFHYAQALKSIVNNVAFDDLRNKVQMLEESLRGFTSDDALMDKLDESSKKTRRLIPGLVLVLEEGSFS